LLSLFFSCYWSTSSQFVISFGILLPRSICQFVTRVPSLAFSPFILIRTPGYQDGWGSWNILQIYGCLFLVLATLIMVDIYAYPNYEKFITFIDLRSRFCRKWDRRRDLSTFLNYTSLIEQIPSSIHLFISSLK
jgi:hypothetical protein